jgi:hypothetical protein
MGICERIEIASWHTVNVGVCMYKLTGQYFLRLGHPHDEGTRLTLPAVKTLEVLPLIDWYAARDDLEAESGVSDLVRADDTTILFDPGFNRKGEHKNKGAALCATDLPVRIDIHMRLSVG